MSALPEAGTPLADAWRRVIEYANAGGAQSIARSIGSDRAHGRSNEKSFGVAQAYGVDGDDLTGILTYAFEAFVAAIGHGADPVDAFSSVGATLVLTGAEVTRDPREADRG